jgi:hypothetical protein
MAIWRRPDGNRLTWGFADSATQYLRSRRPSTPPERALLDGTWASCIAHEAE